jgi:hypothetical protein
MKDDDSHDLALTSSAESARVRTDKATAADDDADDADDPPVPSEQTRWGEGPREF